MPLIKLFARRRAGLALLTVLVAVVAWWSLNVGVLATEPLGVLRALPQAVARVFLLHNEFAIVPRAGEAQLITILAEIRLPRLLLGLLCGAGLGLCGAVAQGLFRNPMADPGLLGISSGAALGAVLTIVIGGEWLAATGVFGAWLLPAMAFAGSWLSMFAVYRLATARGKTDIATMLLAGIAVNAITGAGIGLLSYLAADAELRDLIFWSLGSLEITDRRKLIFALLMVLPALVILPRFANALNANLLGEAEAGHLGFDMERVKRRLIILVALVVGVAVSLSGIIGFVGLVVPHLIRLIAGPDHRMLLPASMLFGAALLVVADIAARSLVAPAEIPIGIITAILGGPFFLWLLVRYRRARAPIC